MQSNRAEQFNHLSETHVNGRSIHKIDLIAIVRICGTHYFNVYRRYNSVYEIVIEDWNGDFYLQRDNRVRASIGRVLCLSEQQINSIYTQELYSFRHGGTPPATTPAPENMAWSEVQREWCAIEINLRGILEDYHRFVSQVSENREESSEESHSTEESDECDECSDCDESSDCEECSECEEKREYVYDEEKDEEDYSDMPELISVSDEENTIPPRNIIAYPSPCYSSPLPIQVLSRPAVTPSCCSELANHFREICGSKRYHEESSETSEQVKEEPLSEEEYDEEEYDDEDDYDEEEESSDDDEPSRYVILRNGTKYRRIR